MRGKPAVRTDSDADHLTDSTADEAVKRGACGHTERWGVLVRTVMAVVMRGSVFHKLSIARVWCDFVYSIIRLCLLHLHTQDIRIIHQEPRPALITACRFDYYRSESHYRGVERSDHLLVSHVATQDDEKVGQEISR